MGISVFFMCVCVWGGGDLCLFGAHEQLDGLQTRDPQSAAQGPM